MLFNNLFHSDAQYRRKDVSLFLLHCDFSVVDHLRQKTAAKFLSIKIIFNVFRVEFLQSKNDGTVSNTDVRSKDATFGFGHIQATGP